MPTMTAVRAALVCVLLGLVCATTIVARQSSRIAFASRQDGNWEIYVTDDAHRQPVRLTTRAVEDRFPLWSPDGSLIAFGSQVGASGWQLWVMRADGTAPRHLCSQISAKGARGWSPDGTRIVLAAAPDGDLEIYSAAADGTALLRLTSSPGEDRDPSWSPDGRRIVFTSMRDGNAEIYTMGADGSGVTRVTHDAGADGTASWAPDGSAILFVSSREGGRELYRVHPDGSGLERLTRGARTTNDLPRWSPDGSRIAFQTAPDGNYEIEILNVRTKDRVSIATSPAYDGSYGWSADSRRLAFISGRDGYDAVYAVNADGTGLERLTSVPSLTPAWAP